MICWAGGQVPPGLVLKLYVGLVALNEDMYYSDIEQSRTCSLFYLADIIWLPAPCSDLKSQHLAEGSLSAVFPCSSEMPYGHMPRVAKDGDAGRHGTYQDIIRCQFILYQSAFFIWWPSNTISSCNVFVPV